MNNQARNDRSVTQASGPQGKWMLGSLLEFRRNPLELMAQWQHQYGDIVRFRLGPRTMHLLSHPDLAEEVLSQKTETFTKIYDSQKPTGLALVLGNGLVTSSGALWKRQRRLIQPIFHRNRLPAMSTPMVEAGERTLKRWQSIDPSQPVDIVREMMQLTLEVITQTMFSTSVLNKIDRIGPALQVLLNYVFKSFLSPLRLPVWVPTPTNLAFQREMAMLDGLVYGLIAERRRKPGSHRDLLDLLLNATDEETGQGINDQQVRDEVLTVFLAGHETTANALSWAWYLLASHPNAQMRLHDELARVLHGRVPTIDDLAQLSYTRSVIEEALRLYPPVPAVHRRAFADTQVGGYDLPAGSIVLISIRNIHRHRDFWESPEEFTPDRFSPESTSNQSRLAYLPFGAGPRVCVGSHFAMTEATLLLALIAQRYELKLVPGRPVVGDLAVTLRPSGMTMTLHPRS